MTYKSGVDALELPDAGGFRLWKDYVSQRKPVGCCCVRFSGGGCLFCAAEPGRPPPFRRSASIARALHIGIAPPSTTAPIRLQVLIKGIPGNFAAKLTDKLLVQQAVS